LTYHDTYTLAFRLTGNEEDARDVVQETYLRTYRSIGRFRAIRVLHLALPHHTPTARRRYPRGRPATATRARAETPVLDLRADHDPAQHVDASTLRARLELAIAELPPGYAK
jgi:RNA polymerase sigma-70 factor (ECF subfamily)